MLQRPGSVALSVCSALTAFFLTVNPVLAADFIVKPDGSGDFTTIQACADAAQAGDTCLVSAGTYPEHVVTARSGSAGARINFKANGVVTMRGFDIRHPYITIQGFDITDYAVQYDGFVTIGGGGNYCEVLNNTIRDGVTNIPAITFKNISNTTTYATGCLIDGNTIRNIRYTMITTAGTNHVISNNRMSNNNNADYFRLFGDNIVIRRNYLYNGTALSGSGNHPDVFQSFGSTTLTFRDSVFEENFVIDMTYPGGQMNQLNSSVDGVGDLVDNVKNFTIQRNVFVNIPNNSNNGMPGLTYRANTFYRLAYTQAGLGFGSSMMRGDAQRATIKNNVFLGGGNAPATVNGTTGFYDLNGQVMSREAVSKYVTRETTGTCQSSTTCPIAYGIFNDLAAKGYTDSNGLILDPARSLTALSQFQQDPQYAGYKTATYNQLMTVVEMDTVTRSTFAADYNYVAGAPSAGYPAKKSSGCVPGATATRGNFCEANGINGGDPHFQNLANPLGLDGIPFTLDDGLKPRATSPLCGKGEGGADIGAYSCDPNKVFSGSGVSQAPAAPASLRIVR